MARDGRRRQRTRPFRRRARAAAARSDQAFADGAPPRRAEPLALHLQRHLHLYRRRRRGRDRRSGPGRRFASLRRCSPRSRARRSRRSSSPIPIAITAPAQRGSARRPARGWSAPRRSCPAAMGRPASIPPTTATIRPTRSSPTASDCKAPAYSIEAVATPGHCSNHLCFALIEENALFSGDHVMAWSTSVVAPPDGSMRAYMASLDKLRGRAETIYWPGHGGPVVEPQRYLRASDPSPAPAGSLDPGRARRRPADDSRPRRQGLRGDQPLADPRRGPIDPRASRRPRRARTGRRRDRGTAARRDTGWTR